MKQYRIDKMLLLEATDGGKKIFEHFLPDMKARDSRSFENTFNPLYNDRHPSFSVYCGDDEKWRCMDFGDSEFQGDAFDFASWMYGLDSKEDFGELLHRIAADLNIPQYKIESEEYWQPIELRFPTYTFTYEDDTYGIGQAYRYFNSFGITPAVLREYCVHSFTNCTYFGSDGEEKKIQSRREQPSFAYIAHTHAKIYTPSSKVRFRYVGKKPAGFAFGHYQILKRNAKFISKGIETFKPRTVLIITGGEKDVLTLTALGYDAICLNSETTMNIGKELQEFFEAYDKIIVMYDTDATGRESAQKLAQRYSFAVIELPESLQAAGGKDVSDYVQLGLNIDVLHKLIEAAPNRNIYDSLPTMPDNIIYDVNAQTLADEILDDENGQTRFLPQSVYDKLPDYLKSITSHFSELHERDLVLLTSIGVLSTCFPNVYGMYDRKKVGLNLYLFVTAPPASGKSVIGWAKKIIFPVKKHLHEEFRETNKAYQMLYNEYSSSGKKKGELPPDEPKEPFIIIPANTSTTMVIDILTVNKNFGLVFETEADALINALKNEWGDWSYILRNAFHHESTTLARVADREYKDGEAPQLSVVLSGTPNQLTAFLNNVENGMFSRFMHYYYEAEPIWKDKFQNDGVDLETAFAGYGEEILRVWKENENGLPIEIMLQEEQIKKFFVFFKAAYEQIVAEDGIEIAPCIHRHALMAFRIAMILTSVRYVGNNTTMPETVFVENTDLDTALQITKVLLVHLGIVFREVREKRNNADRKPDRLLFYNHLPEEFTKSMAISLAEEIGINPATAEKYLAQLLEMGKLKRIKHGKYVKVKK